VPAQVGDKRRDVADALRQWRILDDLDAYYGNFNVWHHAAPLILALCGQAPLRRADARILARHTAKCLGSERPGHRRLLASACRPIRPPSAVVISSNYGSAFGDPDWSLCPKRRIKVVDYRKTTSAVDELKTSYCFLDPGLTDYVLDGFDESAVTELFG
jgi:hypothetical protein